jgi:hypothetical protein
MDGWQKLLAMSGTGDRVAFSVKTTSSSAEPRRLFPRDVDEQWTAEVTTEADGQSIASTEHGNAELSRDGRLLLFSSAAPELTGGDPGVVFDRSVAD